MGFWAGMNEGLTYVLDKKAEKEAKEQDRAFLKETRDEERRYAESQNGIKYLQDRTLATLPLLAEKREQDRAIAAQQAQIGSYFKGRTADLPEEARDAFTNLVLQDSTYSTALMETVQETETKLGRALTGNDILKLTDIFERTKPEGVDPADWIKQAAGMTVTSGSSINFDETVEKLFSGEMTLAEVEQIQMELITPTGTSLGVAPDFATFEFLGVDPATQKSLMEVAKVRINNQFQLDRTRVQEEADAAIAAGDQPSSDLAERNQILNRIAEEPEADKKDSMLLEYYAPTILPELAAEDARYSMVYPQFFQPASVVTYDYVDGVLTPRVTQ